MKKGLKIIAVSALATAALIKGVPALSETLPAQSVSVVRTGDLDLSTTRGRAALEHRMVIAAREVCGTAADIDLVGRNEVRACRSDALTKARTESGRLFSQGRSTRVAAVR